MTTQEVISYSGQQSTRIPAASPSHQHVVLLVSPGLHIQSTCGGKCGFNWLFPDDIIVSIFHMSITHFLHMHLRLSNLFFLSNGKFIFFLLCDSSVYTPDTIFCQIYFCWDTFLSGIFFSYLSLAILLFQWYLSNINFTDLYSPLISLSSCGLCFFTVC